MLVRLTFGRVLLLGRRVGMLVERNLRGIDREVGLMLVVGEVFLLVVDVGLKEKK